MDASKFEQIARNPGRTCQDLENLKANAISKGETELARIADEVLRARFPMPAARTGGPTRTTAAFRGRSETFSTCKEAYLCLLEQLQSSRKTIFEEYAARANSRAAVCQKAGSTVSCWVKTCQ